MSPQPLPPMPTPAIVHACSAAIVLAVAFGGCSAFNTTANTVRWGVPPLTPAAFWLGGCCLLSGLFLFTVGQVLTYLATSAYYAKATHDLIAAGSE